MDNFFRNTDIVYVLKRQYFCTEFATIRVEVNLLTKKHLPKPLLVFAPYECKHYENFISD